MKHLRLKITAIFLSIVTLAIVCWALFQTTGWVISIPISPSELVSAIVALRVMAGRVGQQVREAMW